ncbi:hypothetical protein HYV86_03515 [Candidatus Woesearchaeota archaeon]|nr:hypothetical protein [Candidatus Woesearchaeota archaeon]
MSKSEPNQDRILLGGLYRFQAPTSKELFDQYGMYDLTLRSQGMMFEIFDTGLTVDEEDEYVVMRVVKAPLEYTAALLAVGNQEFDTDRNTILARIKYDCVVSSVSLEQVLRDVQNEFCYQSETEQGESNPETVLKIYEISKSDICEELDLPPRTSLTSLASLLHVTPAYLKSVLPRSSRLQKGPDLTATLVSLERYRTHKSETEKAGLD